MTYTNTKRKSKIAALAGSDPGTHWFNGTAKQYVPKIHIRVSGNGKNHGHLPINVFML